MPPFRDVDPLDYHPLAMQYNMEDDDFVDPFSEPRVAPQPPPPPPPPPTFEEKWTNRRKSKNVEDRRRGRLTHDESMAAMAADVGTRLVGTPIFSALAGDDPRRVSELIARRQYERHNPPSPIDFKIPIDAPPPRPRQPIQAAPVRITQTKLNLQPAPPVKVAGGTIREAPDVVDPFAPMENPSVGNTTPVVVSAPGQRGTPIQVSGGGDPMIRAGRTRERIDQIRRRERGDWISPGGGDPSSRATWDAGRSQRVAAARSGIAAPQPQQQAMALPQVGATVEGWRYLGGDPNDRNSWSR